MEPFDSVESVEAKLESRCFQCDRVDLRPETTETFTVKADEGISPHNHIQISRNTGTLEEDICNARMAFVAIDSVLYRL